MLCRVALVRTDVSEGHRASIIPVTRISVLETKLLLRMVSSGLLRRVALVRTDVSSG
jgi:hypothetical protein